MVFSFFLYPFVVLTLTALYKWKDDKWKATRFVIICLVVSQVCPSVPWQQSARSDAAVLPLLQAIVVGFIAASVAVFGSVVITSAIFGSYMGIVYVAFMLVTWASHGYYLPLWARRSGYAVAGIVVAGGLILSLFEYFVVGRSDLAIIFFSLAYWVIAVALLGTGFSYLVSQGAFNSGAGFGPGLLGGGGPQVRKTDTCSKSSRQGVFADSRASGSPAAHLERASCERWCHCGAGRLFSERYENDDACVEP